VRLITKGGYNWTDRFPWIVEAALKNPQKQFVIDGEAVILGVDGISDFNALHSGKHNEEVQLCAFDLLAMDGDDLRDLPLGWGTRALEDEPRHDWASYGADALRYCAMAWHDRLKTLLNEVIPPAEDNRLAVLCPGDPATQRGVTLDELWDYHESRTPRRQRY
jgi:hypothetical protein